ncbi:MAG: ABC transporter ATP-binding protein [Synergistaceae bacterium]|jgi:branched-chain amino acid transport system ATP-binding protein|nr:ABC transporter ATP-binding protein [Synergistaceae bacterium]
MLEIQNLNVRYGGIHAVRDLSISIDRGEIVTLIGANGAGKSSTIRAVMGLVKGIQGNITYTAPDGRQVSLTGKPPEYMVKMGISLSPEGRRILPHLTVEENMMLGAYSRNDAEGVARDIEYGYTLFPRLRERRGQKGGTLSGGEQQMLAVARALSSHPELLMLDEPSLGLAPILVDEVFATIREINREGRTILLVEQNAFAALRIANKAYVLETGAIALCGKGADLLENPKVKEAYLGG